MNERAVEIRTIEKAAQGDSEMLCQRLNLPQAIAPIGVQIEHDYIACPCGYKVIHALLVGLQGNAKLFTKGRGQQGVKRPVF